MVYTLVLLFLCAWTGSVHAQTSTVPDQPNVLFQRLLTSIRQIQILDNHAHPAFPGDPEMDALTLARQIKSDPALVKLKLVMLTSLNQMPPEAELKTAGFAGWLFTPHRASQLFNCLANALAAATPAGPAAPNPVGPRTLTPVKPGFRVLLAEDDKVNQRVALAQLEKHPPATRLMAMRRRGSPGHEQIE